MTESDPKTATRPFPDGTESQVDPGFVYKLLSPSAGTLYGYLMSRPVNGDNTIETWIMTAAWYESQPGNNVAMKSMNFVRVNGASLPKNAKEPEYPTNDTDTAPAVAFVNNVRDKYLPKSIAVIHYEAVVTRKAVILT